MYQRDETEDGDVEPLPEREYDAEMVDQFGDEFTLFNDENPASWIQTDTVVDVQQ